MVKLVPYRSIARGEHHHPHWSARSKIVCETLESLDMRFPELTVVINEIEKKHHAIVDVEEQAHGNKGKKGREA